MHDVNKIKINDKLKFLGWTVRISSSKRGKIFFYLLKFQTLSGAQPAPCYVVNTVYFIGGKAVGVWLTKHRRLVPSFRKSDSPTPHTYILTPCSRVLREKLTGFKLVKKFPALHLTRMHKHDCTSSHFTFKRSTLVIFYEHFCTAVTR